MPVQVHIFIFLITPALLWVKLCGWLCGLTIGQAVIQKPEE